MKSIFSGIFRQWIKPVLEPLSPEKLSLMKKKWEELDKALKFPQQTAGIYNNACGATHSIMEKCNFACTSCYLSDSANHTPPLPFPEIKKQLDSLRSYLGPAGKTQITSGEVTLLSQDELGKIVNYAKNIGLDPMVMTNGQRFIQYPGYLPALVEKYGLEKISIHIDTTQKGRKGMKMGMSEEKIHPIRDQYARLIKDTRKKSGKKLQAAQTMTVTGDNFAEVPGVMKWMLSNVDAFRMISFQPIAEVGRTKDKINIDMSLEAFWEKVCQGAGKPLNRHSMYFGHPECNVVAPLVVASFGKHLHIIEPVREGKKWDRKFFNKVLRKFGGFTSVHSNIFQTGLKLISLLLRNPALLLETPFYGLYRFWGIRSWLFPLVFSAVTFRKMRIRPLVIVIHRFMSPEELETPLGKERLKACVFKVPVNGKMVSMCELNATSLREDLNREMQRHVMKTASGQNNGSEGTAGINNEAERGELRSKNGEH